MAAPATRCCPLGDRPDIEAIDAALRLIGTTPAEGQPKPESLSAIAGRMGLPKSSLHKHRTICLATDEAEGPEDGRSERAERSLGTGTERLKNKGGTRKSPFTVRNPHDDERTAPRKLVGAALEKACWDRRIKGTSYAEIAEELGIRLSTAVDLVEQVLVRTRRATENKAANATQLEVLRLDRMQEAVYDRALNPAMVRVPVPGDPDDKGGVTIKAYDGQDKAIDKVIKISARRAKLLGLDAAKKVSVSLVDRAFEDVDFTDLFRVIRKALDARYPGASDLATVVLDHYREGGDVAVEAFLAGDLALAVLTSPAPGEPDAAPPSPAQHPAPAAQQEPDGLGGA